jgi:hypothetical protein
MKTQNKIIITTLALFLIIGILGFNKTALGREPALGIDTLSPTDNATAVAIDSNLVITFSETVDAETGYINLYKTTGDELIQAFNVASDISGSGTDTITANPSSDLDGETDYYVKIDATAFDDTSGNSFAGITDTTTWNFTSADVAVPVCSSGSPSGELEAGTTSTTMTLTTNENATCKYSSTSGVSFSSMVHTFSTTSGTSHSQVITGLKDDTAYTYYIRCEDGSNNSNTDDYPISFSILAGGGGLPLVAYNPPKIPEKGFSVIINNGDIMTNNREVSLNLSAGSDTARMVLSNNPDLTNGTGQIPFQSSYSWDICRKQENCSQGTHTVYVKFYTQ